MWDSISAIFQTILGAPLTTIIVVGGFIFIYLGLGGKIGGAQILEERRRVAFFVGIPLVVLGLYLYISPPVLPSKSSDDSTIPESSCKEWMGNWNGNPFFRFMSLYCRRGAYEPLGEKDVGLFEFTEYDKDQRILKGIWIETQATRPCDRSEKLTEEYGRYWGQFRLIFNPDFGSFNGEWGYCKDSLEYQWEGNRDQT